MYVAGEQIQNGIVKYIQIDMLPKLQGWKKIMFGACTSLIKDQNLSDRIIDQPVISMLGIKDISGKIQIDKLKSAIQEQIGNGRVAIQIPVIGTFTITNNDVEKLCNIIKEDDAYGLH